MDIQELVRAQRAYFLSGATRSYAFRMEQLKKLQQALRSNEALLEQAMYQDFRKAPMEVYMCETGMVLDLAVELSRSTLPVAAGGRDLRWQLRRRKAVGLCTRGQRGHCEADCREL